MISIVKNKLFKSKIIILFGLIISVIAISRILKHKMFAVQPTTSSSITSGMEKISEPMSLKTNIGTDFGKGGNEVTSGVASSNVEATQLNSIKEEVETIVGQIDMGKNINS